MSRTVLQDRERDVIEAGRRKAIPYSAGDDLKVCRRLQTRGLVKRVDCYTILTDAGVVSVTSYKATPAGIRVLNGEAAHPESESQKRDREWRGETRKLIAAGKPCDFRGCRLPGIHGHHKQYRSGGGGNEKKNRVMLCEEHHDWVHDNKREAIALGYAVSSHTHIAPAEQFAPSQRRTA